MTFRKTCHHAAIAFASVPDVCANVQLPTTWRVNGKTELKEDLTLDSPSLGRVFFVIFQGTKSPPPKSLRLSCTSPFQVASPQIDNARELTLQIMCSTMPRIYTVACALMLAGARGFVVNPVLRAPCANRGIGTEAAGRRSLSMVSRRMYPALSSPARGGAVVLWGLGNYVALWDGQTRLLCSCPLTMSDVSMLLDPWTRLKGCMFCGCALPPIK